MVRLLSERYDGICCEENYHMELLNLAEPIFQPNLCYMQTMSSWQEFISRTPEEYDAWITGVSREAAQLEIIKLCQLAMTGKRIFVDTNIPLDILREISDYHHVALMLAPQELSVSRFFDRPDAEKQFLYQKILEAPDPEAAMSNYRKCLEKINGPEHYREFAESGFYTYIRTETSTIEQTIDLLETHFLLK